MINSANPTTNYGTSETILLGKNGGEFNRGLIGFDLNALHHDTTIIRADLEFTLTQDGDVSASEYGMSLAYILKKAWTEAGVTWNKNDGSNNWQVAGATGSTDIEAVVIGACDFNVADVVGDKKTIILDPLSVQQFVNYSQNNFGLLLRHNAELNNAYQVGSTQNSTAGNRPKLTIEWFNNTNHVANEITFSGDSKSIPFNSWCPLLVRGLLTETGEFWTENPERLAIVGYTAAQLKTYVDANISALSGSPQAVLLNIGSNDLATGTAEATYKTAVTGVIDAYLTKFPTTTVYVAYPWRSGYDAGSLAMKGWIDAVIATYASGVAAGHNENIWLKPNVANMSWDGTHYNAAGEVECKNQWLTVLGYGA
jgi:hypothetical protein